MKVWKGLGNNMAKTYIYRVIGKDQYKVARIDDKKIIGEKGRFKEYFIDLRDGDVLCDCPGFMYTKLKCKHLKFLFSQLMDKGGILDYEHKGDYDKLIWAVKQKEMI